MITPTETSRLREFISTLEHCADSGAVNYRAHLAGREWRPGNEMAAAMAAIAAQHRKRLDGEIDPQTCAMACERIVTSASGDIADMFA